MIIYSVRLVIQAYDEKELVKWLQDEHIPEMLETGLFSSGRLHRVLDGIAGNKTLVVHYICESLQDYETYIYTHAAAMRQKGIDKFGDKISASRELLEVIR